MPIFDFVKGEVILIDKPYDWTSFDVVNKIRCLIKYHLGIKKIKMGHAGTLDLLQPVCSYCVREALQRRLMNIREKKKNT